MGSQTEREIKKVSAPADLPARHGERDHARDGTVHHGTPEPTSPGTTSGQVPSVAERGLGQLLVDYQKQHLGFGRQAA